MYNLSGLSRGLTTVTYLSVYLMASLKLDDLHQSTTAILRKRLKSLYIVILILYLNNLPR